MKPQKEHTLPEAFDFTASCARSLWSHWARVGVGPPIWNSTDVTVKQAHVILRPSLNAWTSDSLVTECEGDRWLWRGQTLTKDAEIQHAVLSTLEIPLPVLVGPHQCWGCRSAVWKEACHALPSCKSLWESKDVYSRNCMLKTISEWFLKFPVRKPCPLTSCGQRPRDCAKPMKPYQILRFWLLEHLCFPVQSEARWLRLSFNLSSPFCDCHRWCHFCCFSGDYLTFLIHKWTGIGAS